MTFFTGQEWRIARASLPANLKLSHNAADYFEDPLLYRSIVGALQSATITRPELGYVVNKVCQFMSQPLSSHWTAVKRILRYLKGTIHLGLTLQPATNSSPLCIKAFCDAEHRTLMIEDPHQILAFFLDLISSHGGLRSKHWLQNLVLKSSTIVFLHKNQSYGTRHLFC